MNKKILFFYGGSYVYGKERSALNVMTAFQKKGYYVHNLCNGWNNGHFPALLKQYNIHFSFIKLGKLSKSTTIEHILWTINALIRLPSAIWKIRKLIKKINPDFFIVESYYQLFFILNFLKSTPVIVSNHENPSNNFFFRYIKNKSNKYNIHHVGVSQFVCNRLSALGIKQSNIHLVYNSCEKSIDSVQPIVNLGRSLTIGCAGQIGYWKGQEDLVDALISIKDLIQFTCKIAGSGDDATISKLKEKCETNNISDSVIWLGYLPDMNNFYSEIDVCVIPSLFEEPFGRVPVEAGFHKVPSIVTNKGGLPEIVEDGITGFIVPSNNPAFIAKKLLMLAADPDLRFKMGQNAFELYSIKFSLDKQLESYERILEIVSEK